MIFSLASKPNLILPDINLFLNLSTILYRLVDPVPQEATALRGRVAVAGLMEVSYSRSSLRWEVATPGLLLLGVLPIRPMGRVMQSITFLEVGTMSSIKQGIHKHCITTIRTVR